MRVSAFARALLNLVDAQVGGQGLSEMSDAIAPTIEISRMLGLPRQVQARFQTNPVAGVYAIHYTVPPGEVWLVRSLGMQVNCGGAASQVGAHLCCARDTLNLAVLSGSVDTPINTMRAVAIQPDLMLPSGCTIGVLAEQVVGAPVITSGIIYEAFDA